MSNHNIDEGKLKWFQTLLTDGLVHHPGTICAAMKLHAIELLELTRRAQFYILLPLCVICSTSHIILDEIIIWKLNWESLQVEHQRDRHEFFVSSRMCFKKSIYEFWLYSHWTKYRQSYQLELMQTDTSWHPYSDLLFATNLHIQLTSPKLEEIIRIWWFDFLFLETPLVAWNVLMSSSSSVSRYQSFIRLPLLSIRIWGLGKKFPFHRPLIQSDSCRATLIIIPIELKICCLTRASPICLSASPKSQSSSSSSSAAAAVAVAFHPCAWLCWACAWGAHLSTGENV